MLQVQLVEFLIILFADHDAGRLFFLDRGGQLVVLAFDFHQSLADMLHVAHAAFFQFPLCPQIGQFSAQVGHFILDFLAALDGVLFGFFGQLPLGQFKLHQAALHLIDFGGHAFQLHGQATGGLVHQVNGLVGQEAVGDVAMRKIGRRHQRGIFDFTPL